ncbi:lecithin-cholesterol acyltransferase-like 1 [Panicum miliaceum]|uniref:Lecithin-cholesterol acyltransferase-like 1 n=1 Tax=Panicum miliaceum TaxID=4540 RepID=A0A3L6S761_PANMI|nr:lecithin-cholesterol acyltransferase-like 1 [Panicum miliaceum]
MEKKRVGTSQQVLLVAWAWPFAAGSPASGLHPVNLLPGFGCSQLDARLTDEFEPASAAPSCAGGALKGNKGLNRTALLEGPALAPCYAELLRLVYHPVAGDYRNVPGVETRVVSFRTTRGFGSGDPATKRWKSEDLLGAPYDFRYAPAPPSQASREFSRFLSSLRVLAEQASERNGGVVPAILVTHSLGGLLANVFLGRSPLAWRRRYVKHFVMASAGAGGAVFMLRFGGLSSSPADPLSLLDNTGRSFAGAFSVLPSPKVFGRAPLVVTQARNYHAYDSPEYLRASGFSDNEVARYVTRALPLTLSFGAPAVPMTCINGIGVPTPETLVYWDGHFGANPDRVVYGDGDGVTNIASLLALDTLIGNDPEQGCFKSVLIRNTSHGGTISDDFALDRLVNEVLEANRATLGQFVAKAS